MSSSEPVCDECGGYYCIHLYPEEFAQMRMQEVLELPDGRVFWADAKTAAAVEDGDCERAEGMIEGERAIIVWDDTDDDWRVSDV